MRTCIGCRSTRPATEMWRCVLDAETGVAYLSSTSYGRGAWLCRPTCFDLAATRRRFERAWRRPIPDGALVPARDALAIAFESTPENMKHWSSVGQGPDASISTKG